MAGASHFRFGANRLSDAGFHRLSTGAMAKEREQGHRRYLPIVGCTANAFNDEQYRCLAAGMDAVLIKPLTQQDLRTLVSEQQAIHVDMREIN